MLQHSAKNKCRHRKAVPCQSINFYEQSKRKAEHWLTMTGPNNTVAHGDPKDF